jgi:eukaryotic-like serine/threonine-protein kinase
MSLREGETLGPYEIVEPIGKGGMGEVYRARDPRMGREVAIKISTEHFTERFTREVHAIASLNHPNVCTLHDVGPDYLVMELVEGPTLADRIVEGPIPLEEALSIARQICDALEAAHDKGIVHRDLKPGNIKLRSDGTVKVLDFGLAKMGGSVTALSDESPTLSMQATQAGVILGTAAYMAPEQARGKAIDKRADIWAFGVVLHEMVTGRRLFQGEDLTDTIAAVVREKADVTDAPLQLRRVLEKCLEKDPRKRLRDISGVSLLLESARVEEPVGAPAAHVPKPSRLLWIAAGIALVAAAGLAALAFVHFREQPPALQPIQFALEAPPDTGFTFAYGAYAPSPDGRYIVFGAGKDAISGTSSRLWLRPMESLTARVLPGTEAGNFPTWSPDSKSLVFWQNGQLKRIEIAGGSPLMLATLAQAPVTPTGTWNRDGVILVGSGEGLWRVAASGGNATLLTKIDKTKQESGHGFPQFLPDGNRFLYFVESGDPAVQGVYASSLDRPDRRKQIVQTAAKAVYVQPRDGYPGYLLWLREQSLLAQRFDAFALEREGEPTLVADEIGLNPGNSVRAAFWASENGTLIYFVNPPGQKRPLVWMARDGKPLGEAAPEDAFQTPAIAPDGQRIAFSRTVDQGNSRGLQDIWVWEPTRQTMTRLTFDSFQDVMPVWSPDGQRLAFGSVRETGASEVFVKDASGAGGEVRLSQGTALQTPLDWSRDGRYVLVRERGGTASSSFDLVALPIDSSQKPIPLVHTSFNESIGRISPDGAWLAYRSDETGQPEIYIQAFPTPGANGRPLGKWQVSNSGASDMKWRDDGRELYYEAPDGKIMAVQVDVDASGVHPRAPRELFSSVSDVGSLHSFDATGDGARFLILQGPRAGVAGGLHLNVLSNWQASLRH